MDILKSFTEDQIELFLRNLIKNQGDYLRAGEATITEITGENHWGLSSGLAAALKINKDFQARYEAALGALTIQDKKLFAESELKKIISNSRDDKAKIDAIKTYMKLHQLDTTQVQVNNSFGDFLHSISNDDT